jgi:phosphonate degradation associated HDIG domain protein
MDFHRSGAVKSPGYGDEQDITMTTPSLQQIGTIYRNQATGRYGLSDVSQLQHALQSAWLAERNGEPAAMVAAALLHDIGHMIHDLGENPAAEGIDDTHETRAAAWLSPLFDNEVTEPIRMHVAAKRYLCGSDPSYLAKLSNDSILSLSIQGGPMNVEEIAAFEKVPFYHEALRLRLIDDQAKDPMAQPPALDHYLAIVAGVATANRD